MHLIQPNTEMLPEYVAALERGWFPDSIRGKAAADEIAAEIGHDAAAFLARQFRPEGGGVLTLPDGSQQPRLPSYTWWLWDGEFCGAISFRWQHGTPELPPYSLGHIGYNVVPWKRRKGYATEALRQVLPQVAQHGLPYVEITTDPDNLASQRVIEANGGVLHETFTKGPQYGNTPGLRYRIAMPPATDTKATAPLR
jgi:predicted acetyltransferase